MKTVSGMRFRSSPKFCSLLSMNFEVHWAFFSISKRTTSAGALTSMISQTSDFFATTNVIDAIPVKYSMLEPMGLKMLGKYPAVLPAAYE